MRNSMDDEAKIMHFKRGLNPEIAKQLVTNLDQPTEFEGFAVLCTQLDKNIQAFRRNQAG